MHLNAWHSHLHALLNRPLRGDDFIFPAITSTGLLKFGEPMSRSGIEVLLGQAVDGSGVTAGRNGKFTTHCFRRGGVQHRFMWANRKWSLKAVKWWGGWSSPENVRVLLLLSSTHLTVFVFTPQVGMIMRYLLDELMAYEEGFSGILMPDRASARHESSMGVQEGSCAVSHIDLQVFGEKLVQQVQDLLSESHAVYHAEKGESDGMV
jgi:hypothetical protein